MNASIFRSSSYFLNRFTRIARQPRFNWNITIQPRQLAFPFSSDSCKKPEVEPNSKSLEDILKECDTLREENKSLLDKYKRSLADAENLRKRSNKQIEEAKIFAVQNFCKDLLEVADILSLALKSIEEKTPKDKSLKSIDEGITLTKNVLMKVFKKYGLITVSPLGEKFDPNIHEAVLEIPRVEKHHKAGHIAEVLNMGYSLHNRPIRPPKVVVVKDA